MNKANIIKAVAEYYLQSHDFNGIPLGELANHLNTSCDRLSSILIDLVQEDEVTALGTLCVNSHILRTGVPDKATQLEALKSPDIHHTCIYVQPSILAKFVPNDLYANEPYKRELALGAPQLTFRAFDLTVLEYYRNDPRYYYRNSDIDGKICISNEFYESTTMSKSDKVLLETFGFAYNDKMNRAVAVFLRYLARLSPEHQQIWKIRELDGNYKIHPDYYGMGVLGSWETNISICDAVIAEIRLINEMSSAMEREKLFRKDFGGSDEEKPRVFSLLIRPTQKEYHSFVSLLDRMLSDNINPMFFGNDISFENDIQRKDGKIQVERKGTLRVLDEWLRKYYRTDDWTLWEESYETLREIRKIRQRPAHALDDDEFNQKYFKEQRELLERAYSALRIIRLSLQNHPKVRAAGIDIPDFLENNKIVSR